MLSIFIIKRVYADTMILCGEILFFVAEVGNFLSRFYGEKIWRYRFFRGDSLSSSHFFTHSLTHSLTRSVTFFEIYSIVHSKDVAIRTKWLLGIHRSDMYKWVGPNLILDPTHTPKKSTNGSKYAQKDQKYQTFEIE